MAAFGMVMKVANTLSCRRPILSFGLERNKKRDKEEQQQLAKMGWHCITILECNLKPQVRQKTLESLAYTLNHIYLQDHSIRYSLPKEDGLDIAAEEIPNTNGRK